MTLPLPPVFEPFADGVSSSPDKAIPTYLSTGFPAPGTLTLGPPRGFINWLHWVSTLGVRYQMSRGIPEWNTSETEYVTGSIVIDNDFYFYQLTGTATPGTRPSNDLANWSRQNTLSRGHLVDYAREIAAWEDYQQRRRFGIDHWGFPNGNLIGWDEAWDDWQMTLINVAGNTSTLRWTFSTDGGGSAGGILASHKPQYTAGDNYGCRFLGITSITGGTGGVADLQLRPASCTTVFTDDTTVAMYWSFLLPPTATAGCTFQMGFTSNFERAGSISDGCYMYKGPGDTNWQLISVSGGVASTPIDTGIVAGGGTLHRAALILVGANNADNGVAKAILLIDGVAVGTVTAHLPYTSGGAGSGLQISPIVGVVTTAGASAIELLVGPMRYRQTIFAGDKGIF